MDIKEDNVLNLDPDDGAPELTEEEAAQLGLNLDDILKEFSEAVPEPPEEAPTPVGTPEPESVPEPETAPEPEAAPEPEEAPEEPVQEEPDAPATPEKVTGDTIRLDTIAEAVAAAEAREAHPEAVPEAAEEDGAEPDETFRDEELPDEDAPETEEDASEAENPRPEPFSENWEPEYDAPMGEYIPPRPIIPFRPRERLREMKRKLIAGPEKRYYDLCEIGVGKLQAAIFLNLLILLLCAGAAGMYAAGSIPEDRMRLLVFSQILAMLISALLGCYCMMDGFADLLQLKFTLNSMLLFTFIACCADAVFCLQELRVPCCAAFSLEVTMALWNRYHKRSTEMGQMDTMRKASRLDSLVKVPDLYDGKPGLLRGNGQVEDFMDHYDEPSGPEKVQCVFTFISFLVCIGIAVLAYLRHGLSLSIQILSTALLVATPASFFVALTRPMAVLERRLHMTGTVICGWQGVKRLCGKAAFPLTDADLFPSGATKLNGVKFYGDRNPDEIITCAASLIAANGGGLDPVFQQLRKSRGCREYEVDNFRDYGTGGIGGEVNEEPVLMGSLNFLQDMGVEIPEGTMVSQAVYCAIDGQLCAVFAMNYARMKSAAAGLVSLSSYRKITPVLTCDDFMLTDSFIRSKFSVRTRRMAFPDREIRHELARQIPSAEEPVLALTTKDGLHSAAYAVTGARALRSASIWGLALHIAAGILGMLIMAALAYLGTAELLTPVHILLYQLVWMIPGLLITCWTMTV